MKSSLLDKTLNKAQVAVAALWLAVLLTVVGIWAYSSFDLLGTDIASTLLSLGRLAGMLATFFALTQFMLMGRIAWVEGTFGLDKIAGFHRKNGYLAITLLLAHSALIVNSYALAASQSVPTQYVDLLRNYPYVWLAVIAEILFIAVVASSIYIARKNLKFETWYFVHLMVYLAIVIVPFHQFALGGSVNDAEFATYFWYGLYGFVAFNVVLYRFMLPSINFTRYNVTVARVEADTPTTTSVYLHSSRFSKLDVTPGQFVLVRIFAPKLWWQEHPFSISKVPGNTDELRLTIRKVGDYTTDIADLKPGAKVLLTGPFGRFTKEVSSTDKRLYLAGGVGITPLLAMATEAVADKKDAALLYGNTNEDDIVLQRDVEGLQQKGLSLDYILSKPSKSYKGESGYVDIDKIKRLVPDYLDRDVYVCGPPPMMDSLINALAAAGLKPERLHFERFTLHP